MRFKRLAIITMIFCLSGCGLFGCGQKGPLKPVPVESLSLKPVFFKPNVLECNSELKQPIVNMKSNIKTLSCQQINLALIMEKRSCY